MNAYLVAAIQGIVEGLTEFLPVSSTGHMIIAGHLMGFTGEKAAAFEVMIQLGAILAVVVLYWPRFRGLVAPPARTRFAGLRGLWLLMLTSLPASVLGLAVHKYIKAHLFGPKTVALAFAVGAVMILVVESLAKRNAVKTLDEITPRLALGVGLFQCLSLWPGFSRSGATIMGAMILGADRKLATQYSFLAAVPIMVAATGYEACKNLGAFGTEDLKMLALGFVVSFLAAWAAVKGFILLLERCTLRPFAWYRLAMAPVVYFLMS